MSSTQSVQQGNAFTTLGYGSQQLVVEEETTPSISVVVPTYNEAENVEQVIDRLRDALEDYDHEIVVVDDDSPDETWRIARDRYRQDDRVHVHRRTDEKGLATAVAYGFEQSEKQFCAVIDADLQHPPEELPTLLGHASADADIVVGSRYTDFGRIENWPVWRRLVSHGATTLAKSMLPSVEPLADPLSGFFIVRREVVDTDVIAPNGYKILLELLVRCEYDRVEEVPYVFTDRERGDSNLTFGEYVEFLRHMLALRTGIR